MSTGGYSIFSWRLQHPMKGSIQHTYSKVTTRLYTIMHSTPTTLVGVTVKLKMTRRGEIEQILWIRRLLENLNNFKLEQSGGRLPKENGSGHNSSHVKLYTLKYRTPLSFTNINTSISKSMSQQFKIHGCGLRPNSRLFDYPGVYCWTLDSSLQAWPFTP